MRDLDRALRCYRLGALIMAIHSIEYLNARRDAGLGGRSKAIRIVNPVDERARLAGLDAFELARERAYAIFANSRSIVRDFRNSLAAGMTAETEIPF